MVPIILEDFEESRIITDFNNVTIDKVRQLLAINKVKWKDVTSREVKRELVDLLDSLMWNKSVEPETKERELQVIVYLIVKECISNLEEDKIIEGENYILNKIKGSRELRIYGFLILDEELEERYERFWKWYT